MSNPVRVVYKCPGCGRSHYIPIAGDKAWGWNGNLDRPTLTPSILEWTERWEDPEDPSFVIEKEVCHHFVTDGKIIFCSDSTHDKKGQTLDLPDIPENWMDEKGMKVYGFSKDLK